jgi:monoamine oxidase
MKHKRYRQFSRRAFLAGAGATAVATTLPAVGCGNSSASADASTDVIVVGAGFAGLSAARTLVAAGASVRLLEARDRVGGRVLNESIGDGKIVEAGGEFAGKTQTRLLELAAAVGVDTFPVYNSGRNLLFYDGQMRTYATTDAIPPLPRADAQEFFQFLLNQQEPLAQLVPLDAPWTATGLDAVAFDSKTAETWKLEMLASPGARFLFDVFTEAVFAAEPHDLSLLHYLFYIHSGFGTISLATVQDGAQESRFVGGSQLIVQRIAEALGDQVVFNSPVRRILDLGDEVVVETDGARYRAGRVVCALPPTLCGRIDFDPPLPAARDQLTQRAPMGSVIKTNVIYDTPFWRDDGLTGQVVSDTGPVKVTFDNSPPDGSPGIVLGFIVGDEARRWGRRTISERRSAVIDNLAQYFGSRALHPAHYLEHDWSSEPFTRGCYVGFMPPGVWTWYGEALREPVGRIHWAGTETADVWNGYMDGAVRSGEQVTAEIAAAA